MKQKSCLRELYQFTSVHFVHVILFAFFLHQTSILLPVCMGYRPVRRAARDGVHILCT